MINYFQNRGSSKYENLIFLMIDCIKLGKFNNNLMDIDVMQLILANFYIFLNFDNLISYFLKLCGSSLCGLTY